MLDKRAVSQCSMGSLHVNILDDIISLQELVDRQLTIVSMSKRLRCN